MRCYFLSNGHIRDIEELVGLSEVEAIGKAHDLYRERQDKFEGFEVWDCARIVIRHPDLSRQSVSPLPKAVPPVSFFKHGEAAQSRWPCRYEEAANRVP
jgi:hypothetical protein